MRKFVALMIVLAVVVLLPAINTAGTLIGNALIAAFGVTDATSWGKIFIVLNRLGPYILPVVLVIVIILIIKGRGGSEATE